MHLGECTPVGTAQILFRTLKFSGRKASGLKDQRMSIVHYYFVMKRNQNLIILSNSTCLCYISQLSNLLKALAEWKPPPCDVTHIDPRNISTTLSLLKTTEAGPRHTRGTFRLRSLLPEHISKLSNRQFKRRKPLRESLPAPTPRPAPITPAASFQDRQSQPSLSSTITAILAHLVEKSKMLASDSICSVGEELKGAQPYILGVSAWSKQQSFRSQWVLPRQLPQTGQ